MERNSTERPDLTISRTQAYLVMSSQWLAKKVRQPLIGGLAVHSLLAPKEATSPTLKILFWGELLLVPTRPVLMLFLPRKVLLLEM